MSECVNTSMEAQASVGNKIRGIPPVITVKNKLDNDIENLRRQLQKRMEVRAKAEFLGCLDYPLEFIEQVGYPF
jgi:hypothetical protein